MPFVKGKSGNPKGRPQDSLNKVSADKKEILSNFVNDKLGDLPELYDRIKKDNPVGAFKLIMDAAEYCLPKLKAVDHNFGNSDISINVTYRKNDDKP